VFGEGIGSGGVLVTGSVVTVGQARGLFRPPEDPEADLADSGEGTRGDGA
jgi:hypothetical protein